VADRVASVSTLVEAVLDVEAVDWTGARARAEAGTAGIIASLETVEGIGAASRAARPPGRAKADQAWHAASVLEVVLAVLAAGQVVVATAGYAGGTRGPGPTAASLAVATMLVFAAAAVWLFVGGRADQRARSLGTFYLIIAAAFARRFLPVADDSTLAAALRAACPDAFLALLLWRFVGRFPRTVRFGRAELVCRYAAAASLAVGLVLFAATWLTSLHLVSALQLLGRSNPSGIYWGIVLGLALPALPVAWQRGRSSMSGERTRLAVFSAGLAVGIVPMAADILLEVAIPSYRQLMAENRSTQALALAGLLLAVPPVTAYSIVVDRVLDVRMAIGTALRYVFARVTLTAVALSPFVALGIFAYRHRDDTLTQLLGSGRGGTAAALAAAGLVMWLARPRVLGGIDRWRHRAATDVGRDVPRLAASMRNAASTVALAEALETELSRLLQAEHLAVLAAQPSSESFACVRGEIPDLPFRSALGALVTAEATPLPVGPDEPRSCFRFLPPAEQDWIVKANAAVLVPLAGAHNAPLGVIIAGNRPGDLPYAPEDVSFLATLAPAAAFALEAQRSASGDVEPAAECPRCGSIGGSLPSICACGSPRCLSNVPALVAGKVRVDCRVGAGGMGVVYRGYDVALGRVVALKTLTRLSPDAGARLGHEARMMASVVHPNLATIYSLERWRGTPILVVEFLDGGTYSLRLAAGPQPISEVLRLGVVLSSALEHLHARRVLHRDVKPSNVGFSSEGVPKLLDFGLAGLLPVSSPAGQEGPAPFDGEPQATLSLAIAGLRVAGTPLYMSPEAVRGLRPDADFDLWSLSVVLYEAVAGTHPFGAQSVPEVFDRVKAARLPDIRYARPDCPAPVAEAFQSMLSPQRSDRPRSASALRQLLLDLSVAIDAAAANGQINRR